MVILQRIGRIARLKPLLCLALFSPLGCHATSTTTDCINEAARCFHINPLIIKAIIWQESRGRQNTININANRSQDVGLMQINSIHFNTFNMMGISEQELRENRCINIFSGTYLLNQLISQYGNNWNSIGYYHSHTATYHNRYLNKLLLSLRTEIGKIESIRIFSTPEERITSRFINYCVVTTKK